MKKRKTFFKAFLFIPLIAGIISCEKEGGKDEGGNDNSDLKTITVTTSRTTNYGDDWIYFSFKDGKEVSVNEEAHKTDLSWDIAFNRYNIRTNSGTSGNGQGEPMTQAK